MAIEKEDQYKTIDSLLSELVVQLKDFSNKQEEALSTLHRLEALSEGLHTKVRQDILRLSASIHALAESSSQKSLLLEAIQNCISLKNDLWEL